MGCGGIGGRIVFRRRGAVEWKSGEGHRRYWRSELAMDNSCKILDEYLGPTQMRMQRVVLSWHWC